MNYPNLSIDEHLKRGIFSYFPGCSMISTAKESSQALAEACRLLNLTFEEIDDWNCCGSSSLHMLNRDLSLAVASRNFSRAKEGIPIVVMCPSCLHNLKRTRYVLSRDETLRKKIEERLNRGLNLNIEVYHFLEITAHINVEMIRDLIKRRLKGIKVAPYYGCMLASPSVYVHDHGYPRSMERTLRLFDAEIVLWEDIRSCCGTFLSVTKPEYSQRSVARIMENAIKAQADCIVTACSMCQLNLEIRAPRDRKIPVFHYAEILSFALGAENWENWTKYHIINPSEVLSKVA